jgi:predicted negative regulator of RcsB-dependent stress response
MDKISRLSYFLYQSDDEEVKEIAIQLLNGDVLLKEIKKTKSLKAYIKATESKINKVDTHEVALFVEKFMLMEV